MYTHRNPPETRRKHAPNLQAVTQARIKPRTLEMWHGMASCCSIMPPSVGTVMFIQYGFHNRGINEMYLKHFLYNCFLKYI